MSKKCMRISIQNKINYIKKIQIISCYNICKFNTLSADRVKFLYLCVFCIYNVCSIDPGINIDLFKGTGEIGKT